MMTPEKDPATFGLLTYAWVFVLSIFGGAVSFFRRVQLGRDKLTYLGQFCVAILTSAFSGLMTFYLCQYAGLDAVLTAAFVGISGHMGTLAIEEMERTFVKFVDRRTGRE